MFRILHFNFPTKRSDPVKTLPKKQVSEPHPPKKSNPLWALVTMKETFKLEGGPKMVRSSGRDSSEDLFSQPLKTDVIFFSESIRINDFFHQQKSKRSKRKHIILASNNSWSCRGFGCFFRQRKAVFLWIVQKASCLGVAVAAAGDADFLFSFFRVGEMDSSVWILSQGSFFFCWVFFGSWVVHGGSCYFCLIDLFDSFFVKNESLNETKIQRYIYSTLTLPRIIDGIVRILRVPEFWSWTQGTEGGLNFIHLNGCKL